MFFLAIIFVCHLRNFFEFPGVTFFEIKLNQLIISLSLWDHVVWKIHLSLNCVENLFNFGGAPCWKFKSINKIYLQSGGSGSGLGLRPGCQMLSEIPDAKTLLHIAQCRFPSLSVRIIWFSQHLNLSFFIFLKNNLGYLKFLFKKVLYRYINKNMLQLGGMNHFWDFESDWYSIFGLGDFLFLFSKNFIVYCKLYFPFSSFLGSSSSSIFTSISPSSNFIFLTLSGKSLSTA